MNLKKNITKIPNTSKTYPFGKLEAMIAFRYLRARKKEGVISIIAWLSFLGIMLGVATLIVVMAVMNGFRAELLQKILSVNGHINARTYTQPIRNYETITEKINHVTGVKNAIAYVQKQAMLSSTHHASGVLVRGIKESDLKNITAIANQNLQGTLDGFDDKQAIAIGTRIAQNHGIKIGDRVTLISPQGPETPFGVLPRMRAFKIAAIFEIGMSDYDNVFVYMPLKNAMEYFLSQTGVTDIEISVQEPEKNSRLIPILQNITKKQNQNIHFETWQERNQLFFNALKVERNVMFLILTLIIIVAALNIISSMIMLVRDKKREIAILRTMGMGKYAILRIFFMTGGTIGIIGTATGCGIGMIICIYVEEIRLFLSTLSGNEIFSPEIYYLSQLPAKMEWRETITVIIMALFLSLTATLYPAWRAAQLQPAQALREE